MGRKQSGESKGGLGEALVAGTVAVLVIKGLASTAFAESGHPSKKPDHKDTPPTTAKQSTAAPKNPTELTVRAHISRADAEKLFGVDLQESMASNPTAKEVEGIQHVADVIGKNSYGWNDRQDSCLEELWTNESNWRGNAWNTATATGIPQALWSLHGPEIERDFPDYKSNVVSQVEWGMIYIANRYGTPCQANYMWHHQSDPNGNPWY